LADPAPGLAQAEEQPLLVLRRELLDPLGERTQAPGCLAALCPHPQRCPRQSQLDAIAQPLLGSLEHSLRLCRFLPTADQARESQPQANIVRPLLERLLEQGLCLVELLLAGKDLRP